MRDPAYDLARADVIDAIISRHPDTRPEIQAEAIIDTLIEEGWLREPARCSHGMSGDGAWCERFVRPDEMTCQEH